MRKMALFLFSLILYGCAISSEEHAQQVYWSGKAAEFLSAGRQKEEILKWAEENGLHVGYGGDLALIAEGVATAWPHFPCASTFTMINLKFDEHEKLQSFWIGRGGICL